MKEEKHKNKKHKENHKTSKKKGSTLLVVLRACEEGFS